MKKLVLLLMTTILVSCGGDKKKEAIENKEVLKDKYSVGLEAIYEKNDSIVVFYQIDNYFQYEKPTSLKIIGSPLMQKLSVTLPSGVAVENIKITASTNKEQSNLTIKNISIKNNNEIVENGDNGKHSDYFLTDETFSWDVKNSRYNLDHTKKYPPSLVGNDKLLSLLIK